MRALHDTLARLQDGVGGIVTLVGEAGIGKSRLVAELKGTSSILWVEGRCLSYRSALAYDLWLTVLHDLLAVPTDASSVQLDEALAGRIQTLCPEQSSALYPYLARLLSLPLNPEQEAVLRGLDPESLQAITFGAVATLVERLAQNPLVIVCEDLHWADSTSIALLERLMPLTDRVPLLLICLFRPERTGDCWRIKETAARLHPHRHVDLWLGPLDAKESQTLVDNLLRGDVSLQEQILARAEGNPFYVQEIVRSLIDSSVITYDETHMRWSSVRAMGKVSVPDTLYGILMSRVDRLPEAAKQVLQLASVIGRIFDYRVLAALVDARSPFLSQEEPTLAREPETTRLQQATTNNLDNCLSLLQREQMIRERARLPAREFAFEHQLTLEAVYGTLLTRQRRRYHRAAAEVIERLYPDRLQEEPGLLAYHWERAGETQQAIEYLRRAGERAAAQFANQEAERHFTRALDLLAPENVEQRSALLQARVATADLMGKRDAQRRDLALLKELAETMEDPGRQAWVALQQAHYAIRTQAYASAADAARIAIRLARSASEPALEAAGYREWGRALFYLQEHDLARQKLDHALALAREAGERSIETDCLQNLGAIGLMVDDPAVASARFREMLHLSLQTGNRLTESVALRGLGVATGDMGEYAEARACLEQSLRLCQETGDRRDEGWALLSLGDLFWAVGDYGQARAYHEQSLEVCQAAGDRLGECRSLLILGDVSRREGAYAQAEVYLQQALKISREIGASPVPGWALAGLGLVRRDQGDLADAKNHIEQAIALRGKLDLSAVALFADLAEIHLLEREFGRAQTCIDQIQSILEHVPDPSASLWAPAAYLACYRVSQARGDPRSDHFMCLAHRTLLACADRIHDEELRRSFLENVPAHREIIEARGSG
jgi:predicted ATPase